MIPIIKLFEKSIKKPLNNKFAFPTSLFKYELNKKIHFISIQLLWKHFTMCWMLELTVCTGYISLYGKLIRLDL